MIRNLEYRVAYNYYFTLMTFKERITEKGYYFLKDDYDHMCRSQYFF